MHVNGAVIEWMTVAAALTLLFSLLLARLRAAHYSPVFAAGLCLMGLAQPAYMAASTGLRAGLLSTAAFAVATTAAAFVHRQDPRRIVLLGGSLAGAQFVHPAWGLAASIILPLALHRCLSVSHPGRIAGLYISLLFIPAFAVITLLYLLFIQHIEFPHWAVVSAPRYGIARFGLCVLTLLTIIPSILAASFLGMGNRATIPIVALCAVIVTVSVVFGAWGQTQLLECAAVLSVLLLLIVSIWPERPRRCFRAALLVGGNASACWLFALTSPGLLDA